MISEVRSDYKDPLPRFSTAKSTNDRKPNYFKKSTQFPIIPSYQTLTIKQAQFPTIAAKFASLEALVLAIRTEAKKIQTNVPDEIAQFRNGRVHVGTNDQYFTTWDFANGMLRDYSMYTWKPLLLSYKDEKFSLEQCAILAKRFDFAYSNYLRYSNFPTLGAFAENLIKLLEKEGNRDTVTAAVETFLIYLNRLNSWSYHFFPWSLGEHFFFKEPSVSAGAATPDLNRRVSVTTGIKVKLTWYPINISVTAYLATNENPDLYEEVAKALPFTVLMDHAMVSGKSMYAWAPMISTAAVQTKERQCDAPLGRIRYSQGTGDKIIVQYGEVTEDIETPILGEVLTKDIGELAKVGEMVWQSSFRTKEMIWFKMEKA